MKIDEIYPPDGHAVAYRPRTAVFLGSVDAAILLSQLAHLMDAEGRVAATNGDLARATGLTKWKIQSARKLLADRGYVNSAQCEGSRPIVMIYLNKLESDYRAFRALERHGTPPPDDSESAPLSIETPCNNRSDSILLLEEIPSVNEAIPADNRRKSRHIHLRKKELKNLREEEKKEEEGTPQSLEKETEYAGDGRARGDAGNCASRGDQRDGLSPGAENGVAQIRDVFFRCYLDELGRMPPWGESDWKTAARQIERHGDARILSLAGRRGFETENEFLHRMRTCFRTLMSDGVIDQLVGEVLKEEAESEWEQEVEAAREEEHACEKLRESRRASAYAILADVIDALPESGRNALEEFAQKEDTTGFITRLEKGRRAEMMRHLLEGKCTEGTGGLRLDADARAQIGRARDILAGDAG